MTKWIIDRSRSSQKEADIVDRMGNAAGLAQFGGGLLGDPTTYLPGTLGVRGVSLARKAELGALTGPELKALAARNPVYGAIGDGLRNAALNGSVMIAEKAMMAQADPTQSVESVAQELILPAAISGSLGALTGGLARRGARNLLEDAANRDFLRGVPPAGTAFSEEELAAARGPGAAAPAGAPDNGIIRNGVLHPGSLATDYGGLRTAEADADPTISAFKPGRKLRAGELEEGPIRDLAAEFHDATGKRLVDVEFRTDDPTAEIQAMIAAGRAEQQGSAGAALSAQSQIYRREVLLAQGRMAPTGIGIEKLPLDPVQRAFMGQSVSAMRLITDLVSTGGRITVGNTQGIANLPPVEAVIASTWRHPMTQVIRDTHDNWAAYRASLASTAGEVPTAATFAGRSDLSRLSGEVGTALKDRFNRGQAPLSFGAFRARLGRALNNGDADAVEDGATPYVNAAAAKHRALYDRVKKEAVELGVFDEAYRGAMYDAQSEVRALKKEADQIKARANIERWSADREREAEEALIARTEDAQFRLNQTTAELEKLRSHGPQIGTAPSYRPRLWNVDALKTGEQHFMDIAVGWLQSRAGGSLDVTEAARIAKEIHNTLSKQNPVFEAADAKALFKSVASPGSAMARSFRIPDALVKDFLEDDAETLMRFHMNQMGTAIEMKRRFGSLDLADEIAEIEQEYRGLIIKANEGSEVATDEAKQLTAQMKGAIADAQAVRDKLYGTYGAAKDPHAWDSRLIRMAKQFTNLTTLGMSGITALGDLVRPIMTEGMDATFGYGLRTLMSDSRSAILRMSRGELELAGDGTELLNNLRALQATDTGDIFGSRGRIEHGLHQANSWFFVANGLNAVNQLDKEWAGVIIQGRVNKALLDLLGGAKVVPELAHLSDVEIRDFIAGAQERIAKLGPNVPEAQALRRDILVHEQQLAAIVEGTAGGSRLSDADRGRFAAVGIDEATGRRIALQLKIYKVDFKSISLANSEEWTDKYAQETYRQALYQMVNRTVPTPGVGDRANWMSTELGSLLSQYKSFAAGAVTRTLTSGLQEGGNRFWYGAAAAVGFAMVLNEIRSRLFYDRSTFDRPPTAVLADAIDRSSILGWFSDANRAVETLTGHRMGFRPLAGAEAQRTPTAQQVAGTVAGPFAGQAFRAADVANDFFGNHVTSRTWANARQLTPGGNLPYLDPVMDRLISDGNFHRNAPAARQINRALTKEKVSP